MNGVFMDGGVVARPLSVGEIFDRALTVYVKQWRRFTLLAAILSLPATWITYVTAVAKGQNISAAAPSKTGPSIDQLLTLMFGTTSQRDLVLIWVSIGISILVTVAVYPAFVRGLRSVYEDRVTTFSEWLAPGFHRFGRLLGILGLWCLVVIAMGIVVAIAFLPMVFLPGLFGMSQSIAIVVSVILAGCIFFVVGVVAIGMGIAFDWSLFIATDEDRTAVAAVQEGISRAMRRGRFWRTIGITLALAALDLIVGVVLNAAVSSVFLWTRSALLYTALTCVLSLPFYAYSGLVISIYFFDSRSRDNANALQPVT